jgi:hypothetical protein
VQRIEVRRATKRVGLVGNTVSSTASTSNPPYRTIHEEPLRDIGCADVPHLTALRALSRVAS